MNAIEQIKADYTLRRHEIINQGDFGRLIGVVRFAQAVHYFRTGEWVENYSILHHSFGGDRGLYGLIIETLCDLDGKEPPFTELTEKQIHAWHVHAGCDVNYARESQHFKFMDERLRAMRVPTSASDYFDNDEWFVSFHSELFDAVCDRIEREALAKLQPAPAAKSPGASKKDAAIKRQDERWKMCVDAGLSMPKDSYAQYPRGIGGVAQQLGIATQSLSEDLNKYRERNFQR